MSSGNLVVQTFSRQRTLSSSPDSSPHSRANRPSLFISWNDSRRHSISSGSSYSSSNHSAQDVLLASSSSTSLSQSHQSRRPLPQLPPPCLVPFTASAPSPSSASSPTAPRPRRALPMLPPPLLSPPIPSSSQSPPPLRPPPIFPAAASHDLSRPSSSSGFKNNDFPIPSIYTRPSASGSDLKLPPKLPFDDSSSRLIRRPPAQANAVASSSKVQLPPLSVPVYNIDDDSSIRTSFSSISTPPTASSDNSHTNLRSRLRVQTTTYSKPNVPLPQPPIVQPVNQPLSFPPLPHQPAPTRPPIKVQIQSAYRTQLPSRIQSVLRRSSLDSLTTRSASMFSANQSLFPKALKRRNSGSGSGPSPATRAPGPMFRSQGGLLAAPVDVDDEYDETERLSPLEFKPRRNSGSGSTDDEDGPSVATSVEKVIQEPINIHMTPTAHYPPPISPFLNDQLTPTAEQVRERRLNKLRRKFGETVIREFDIGMQNSGGSRKAVDRVLASDGEQDSVTDDDDEDSLYADGDSLYTGGQIEDRMTFATRDGVVDEDDGLADLDGLEPGNGSDLNFDAQSDIVHLSQPAYASGLLKRGSSEIGTISRFRRNTHSSPSVGLHSLETTTASTSGTVTSNAYVLKLRKVADFKPKRGRDKLQKPCVCGKDEGVCDGSCVYKKEWKVATGSGGFLKAEKFSRRWFKEKGGKRWEEKDVDEILETLRKL